VKVRNKHLTALLADTRSAPPKGWSNRYHHFHVLRRFAHEWMERRNHPARFKGGKVGERGFGL